jgi:hypothetical protein
MLILIVTSVILTSNSCLKIKCCILEIIYYILSDDDHTMLILIVTSVILTSNSCLKILYNCFSSHVTLSVLSFWSHFHVFVAIFVTVILEATLGSCSE